MNCLFEELEEVLAANVYLSSFPCRLTLLGLTFMNYRPSVVGRLLHSVLRYSDQLLLACQLLRSVDLQHLVETYRTKQARSFNWLMLQVVGLQESLFTYFARFAGHTIEMGFSANREVLVDGISIRPGREIITAISHRYTEDELRDLLPHVCKRFELHFNESHSVAIALLKSTRGRRT